MTHATKPQYRAFAVGMTLNWMPHHAFSGCAPVGGTSHSLLAMLFVYVTARMVALAKSLALERRVLHFSIPLALCVVIIGGYNLMGYVCGCSLSWNSVKWITDYNSPATWSIGVMLVVMFVRKVKLPVWIERVAAFFAPSMFGVYLLHDTTSFGHELFRQPQSWMVAHWQLPIGVAILLSAMATFAVCVLVDLMRRGCLEVVIKVIPRFPSWKNIK